MAFLMATDEWLAGTVLVRSRDGSWVSGVIPIHYKLVKTPGGMEFKLRDNIPLEHTGTLSLPLDFMLYDADDNFMFVAHSSAKSSPSSITLEL